MSNASDPGSWSSTPQPQPPGGASGGGGQGPSGPRASFGTRLVALIIDAVILALVGAVLRGILGFTVGSLLGVIINFGYYAYFEGGPAGQTVGKLAMGIRVIRFDNGGPLGWGTALLRNLCRIISGIPCALGYFWMLWDPEKQTWHDKLSNTVVVPSEAYPPPPSSFGQPPPSA